MSSIAKSVKNRRSSMTNSNNNECKTDNDYIDIDLSINDFEYGIWAIVAPNHYDNDAQRENPLQIIVDTCKDDYYYIVKHINGSDTVKNWKENISNAQPVFADIPHAGQGYMHANNISKICDWPVDANSAQDAIEQILEHLEHINKDNIAHYSKELKKITKQHWLNLMYGAKMSLGTNKIATNTNDGKECKFGIQLNKYEFDPFLALAEQKGFKMKRINSNLFISDVFGHTDAFKGWPQKHLRRKIKNQVYALHEMRLELNKTRKNENIRLYFHRAVIGSRGTIITSNVN